MGFKRDIAPWATWRLATLDSFCAAAGGGALKISAANDRSPISVVGKQRMSRAGFRFLAAARKSDVFFGSKSGALRLARNGRIDRGKAEALSKGGDEELLDLKVTADGPMALRALEHHLKLTDAARRKRHHLHADRQSKRLAGIEGVSFRSVAFNSTGRVIMATGRQCIVIWVLESVNEWPSPSKSFAIRDEASDLLSCAFIGKGMHKKAALRSSGAQAARLEFCKETKRSASRRRNLLRPRRGIREWKRVNLAIKQNREAAGPAGSRRWPSYASSANYASSDNYRALCAMKSEDRGVESQENREKS